MIGLFVSVVGKSDFSVVPWRALEFSVFSRLLSNHSDGNIPMFEREITQLCSENLKRTKDWKKDVC